MGRGTPNFNAFIRLFCLAIKSNHLTSLSSEAVVRHNAAETVVLVKENDLNQMISSRFYVLYNRVALPFLQIPFKSLLSGKTEAVLTDDRSNLYECAFVMYLFYDDNVNAT